MGEIVMKNWFYIALSISLLSGSFQSCKDDDEIESLEEQLKAKNVLIRQLEEEKNSLNDTNKRLEETNKKLDELIKKLQDGDSGESEDPWESQDTTSVIVPTGNTYENPGWKSVAISGDYAYTMTVVFELPAELKSKASSDDLMAAFVGSECRCVKKAIDGKFLLTVIGTGSETTNVTFRYWNAADHCLYESLVSVPFSSDQIFGVVDSPKKFVCKQL